MYRYSKCNGTNQHKGSRSYVDIIDNLHHVYIHQLFRTTLDVKSVNSSFEEFSFRMNTLSAIATEERTNVSLTRRQVGEWFKQNKGKLISPS